LHETKRKNYRDAVRWAYVSRVAQRCIALLLTFVLAGILGPKNFGVVAMATAYILFIEMFVAQGMAAAIVQRKNLAREHLDSVFWLVLAAAALLTAASIVVAPWWAAVNGLPELGAVISVLSISIPINAVTIVHTALRQREMDFRTLALLSGASSIIAGAVGVMMALLGCGVWSLVAQQLIRSALWSAALWEISLWRPRLRFSFRHMRALLGVSGGMLVSRLGEYAASQSDAILMGIFFGPLAVGLYRMAERLMTTLLDMASRSLQAVSVPHFSSLQDDADALRKAVLSCIRLSASITIPAMAVIAAVSDPLMAVLGEKWMPAAAVLKIVVIMGIGKAVTFFTDPLLLARNRPWTIALLAWTLGIVTATTLGTVGAMMNGAPVERQLIAIAIAHTTVFVLLYGIASFTLTRRLCGASARQFAAAIAPGLGAGLASALTATAIATSGMLWNGSAAVALIATAAPAAIAAGITLILLDPTIRQIASHSLRCALHRNLTRTVVPSPRSRIDI
jgi:O-antigen/teichoic acid export membrane protein